MSIGAFAATSGAERLSRWAILGLVLVPLLIGGLLTWALAAPTAHLDRVTAAIVNNDEPVTLNGQTVPLGRQFAAGLIAGSTTGADEAPSVSPSTAPSGSAAPTSSPTPVPSAAKSGPRSGNFNWILTNSDDAASGLRDGRYAAVVTIPPTFSAAATSFSGQAASARQAVFEVATTPASAFLDPALTEAVTSAAAASINQQLIAQYLGNVYAGFNTINEQIGQAAEGAASLVTGADSVSSGAQSLSNGAGQLNSALGSLDAGSETLANGLGQLDSAAQSLPADSADLAASAAQVSGAVGSLNASVSDATTQFTAVVAQLCATPGPLCSAATTALARLQNAQQQTAALATGAEQVASGNALLADAMTELVAGIDSSAAGASQLASGAEQASAGAGSLSAGAQSLASGASQLDAGAAQLSQGLAQAVEQIPTYSDSDIATLSSVVSQPVLAEQALPQAGFQSIPLFAVVALWLGGLVIALARRAVPTRLLLSSVGSGAIALRSLGPTAALGAAQGALLAIVVLTAVTSGPIAWMSFVAGAVLIGAVFAVVNQGLAALCGAIGRLLALLIAVAALAAGLTSTVPAAVDSAAAAAPTAPGLSLLAATLDANGGNAWAAIAGLLVWAVLGAALIFAGVSARRSVRAQDVLERQQHL